MGEGKYILFFFGALGAFNGLLLAFYFLFITKKRNLPSFFLGCLLFALSIRIGKSVFVYFDPKLPKIFLQIGLSACFLIGPSLRFFIFSVLNKVTRIPLRWKYEMGILLAIVLIGGLWYPYQAYPKLWNLYFAKFIYAEWFLYLLISAQALIPLFKSVEAIKTFEKWLLFVFSVNVVIFIAFLFALLFSSWYDTYFAGALIFSFTLYSLLFIQLYKIKGINQFYFSAEKYSNRKLNEGAALGLVGDLENVLKERELYKNPNLNLTELAKLMNVSSHHLSQVLNEHLGKNFTSYINSFRIEEACKMIRDGHPFSVESIGYEVGFNAKSTFYAAFKKLKGTTPSAYKESQTHFTP